MSAPQVVMVAYLTFSFTMSLVRALIKSETSHVSLGAVEVAGVSSVLYWGGFWS